jgi:hypothetical protein
LEKKKMAFKSKDGSSHNSKFRAARKDREMSEGPRAQAYAEEGRPNQAREEELEEQVAPGIHDKVHAMAAQEHGPAHTVTITHDHEAGMHHVHAVHADGHEQHSDHADAPSAHMAAGEAAGADAGDGSDGESNPDGNYPEENEAPKGKKKKHKAEPKDTAGEENDDYEPESLD